MNNPCEGCRVRMGHKDRCVQTFRTEDTRTACGLYSQYLGYQECQAECEARIQEAKKQERQRIVEWLREQNLDDLVAKGRLTSELEARLGKE